MAKIQPFQSRLDTTFADAESPCPFMLIGIGMIFDILSQSIHVYFCGGFVARFARLQYDTPHISDHGLR
jgi:hypothetical protein